MKSKISTVFERLRRKSSPEVIRRLASSCIEPYVAPIGCVRSQSVSQTVNRTAIINFFSLPTELHIQIIETLSFKDLCALRLVSTEARDLLAEGEVIGQWIIDCVPETLLKLHPSTASPTFHYALEQYRRIKVASQLATLLAEYIVREILYHTLRRLDIYPDQSRDELFDAVRIRLQERLVPLIMTTQHYLEHCAATLLDVAGREDFEAAYRSREQLIIDSYETDRLLFAHKFWMFLCWLHNQILNRPSYVGTLERTVRGWITEPLDSAEFRLFVVFGNISAMSRLTKLNSYKQRRKAVDTLLRQLDPDQNMLWKQNWAAIAPRYGEYPTKEQAVAALRLRLSATDLWAGSARAALAEEDAMLVEGEEQIGTPWQVMDFLCDLAGYDVLHTPPSMMP